MSPTGGNNPGNPSDPSNPDDTDEWTNPENFHDPSEFLRRRTPQQIRADVDRQFAEADRATKRQVRPKQLAAALIGSLLVMGCGIWQWVATHTSSDRTVGVCVTGVFGLMAVMSVVALVLQHSDNDTQQ